MLICLLLFAIAQAQNDLHRDTNYVERKIGKHTERFYDMVGLCSEAGYRRNETDASQFYRCVDYDGNAEKFIVFKFACPPALEFDENLLVCISSQEAPIPITVSVSTLTPDDPDSLTLLPPSTSTSAASGTDHIVESTSIGPETNSQNQELTIFEKVVETSNIVKPTIEMDCGSNKLYRLPNSDSNLFYQCHLKSVSIFSCAPGLVFDEVTSRCSLPEESNREPQVANPITDKLPDYFDIDCSSGVLRRYPFDCRNFYQCYDNGLSKSILFYSCSAGLIFDEESNKCLLPHETSNCYANDSPFKPSQFDYHLQRLFQSMPNAFAQ